MKIDLKTLCLLIIEALLFGAILIGMQTCSTRSMDGANRTISALRDSIEVVELKNGDLLYEKQSLLVEKAELEEYLDVSKKEIKEIERSLNSSLAYIADLEGKISLTKEITVRDSLIYVHDTLTRYSFDYKDNWLEINGLTDIRGKDAFTTLQTISVPMNLSVGLTENYNIFVKTDNPYVSFNNITGAVIDKSTIYPRPKRFNIGIQVGVGPQYDFVHRTLGVGVYAGFGLSYGFCF